MKKSIKLAAALAVAASPSVAANLENPLYLPNAGGLYSKTGLGVMYKKADDADAQKAKGHDGAEEFPIWRVSEEIGYGLTDRLSAIGSFGYTHDGDIGRKGMHLGRLGLNYRALDGAASAGWILDVYADAHLGGVSEMTGSYSQAGFKYDNYTNGRWGFYAGAKFGRTWGKFTAAAFAEVLHTFGNANNSIDVRAMKSIGAAGIAAIGGQAAAAALCGGGYAPACRALGLSGLADDISVNLKSTTEYNFGVKGFYELDSAWSVGGGFAYKHHADNGVESVATAQNNAASAGVANALAAGLKNMNDGFDEYVLSASVANRLTETVQVALYGEYTLDTAHEMSQNGTDAKAEIGVRANVAF